MRKKLLAVIMAITALVALIFMSQSYLQVSSLETTSEQVTENHTLQIFEEKLAGASEEEIDAYFASLSDDKRVIADEFGGCYARLDNSDGPVVVKDKDGNDVTLEFSDEKDSATVGEIKEHLKSLKGN